MVDFDDVDDEFSAAIRETDRAANANYVTERLAAGDKARDIAWNLADKQRKARGETASMTYHEIRALRAQGMSRADIVKKLSGTADE